MLCLAEALWLSFFMAGAETARGTQKGARNVPNWVAASLCKSLWKLRITGELSETHQRPGDQDPSPKFS